MVQRLFRGNELGKYLIEEGVLPPQCRNVELLLPVDGALALRYEVFVTAEDLPKLARCLVRLGESATPVDTNIWDQPF